MTWQKERYMDGPGGVDYTLRSSDGATLARVTRDFPMGGNFWSVRISGVGHETFNGLGLAKRNAEHRVSTGSWATDTYGRAL